MNLINAEKIEKTHGVRKLFADATFGIQDKEKIAVIGANGCGKTTLLRIIAGTETADAGSLIRSSAARIALLEQVPRSNPADTVGEHLLRGKSERAVALRKYEICAEKAKEGDPAAAEELAALADTMERLDAWDYERKVHSVLQGFGIHDLSMTMGSLSGGMAKKVALAQALIEEANLLILDEPTNHLDIDSIVWLQDYLTHYNGAVAMVTHDRYFLDSVCTAIYEIDRAQLFRYEGNYDRYLELKSQQTNALQQEDQRVASILRTELEWLRRGPKARGTKAKARKDRAYELMAHENFKEADSLEISVAGRRLGKKILEAYDIKKSYDGRTVITGFSHIFKNGERIGVVGANGSGKTTLLNMLTGTIPPDSGSIETGMHTSFGYFTQTSLSTDPQQRVIDFVEMNGKTVTLADGSSVSAAKMLEIFLFPAGLHYTPVEKLSGGERRRLYLLQVLMGNPNFLILDEPTNDLDVKTLSILEDFLQNFSGCILVVSHDRYFMDRVADYLFVLDGKGDVKSFPGNFTDYLEYTAEKKNEKKAEVPAVKSAPQREKAPQEKKKLSFKEQREYETIEADILGLETEKETLLEKIGSGSSDPAEYAAWSARLAELENLITEKYARWEYLEKYALEK
ncbi:MAG: ABC-F family ATP-binding cassette domain-containing protein [Spirochaetota bacterium]